MTFNSVVRLKTAWWAWMTVFALLMTGALAACYRDWLTYEPQEGDVVFQALPRNELVRTIEGVTRSPYSHCGIVARSDQGWVVIESLGTVHETGLREWIMRGRGAQFEAYRLPAATAASVVTAIAAARTLTGRAYDPHYRLDNDDIYCSELVLLAYRAAGFELGQHQRLGDLDWQPYADSIRRIEQGPVPMDRVMVTPVSLTRQGGLTLTHGHIDQ